MKKLFILISLLLTINICLSQETEAIQKTMLITTNLTKDELCQLLSKLDNGTNNTSIEEVETEAISDSETEIKNGKVKIKIKLEFDLKDDPNNKIAFIQTVTPIQKEDGKLSFMNYFMALSICIILIACFYYSLKMKGKGKAILNKYSIKKEYLLKEY